MLLAAAEFPSISWWNVPSLSPYQVVSFMAGIEVYTASVSFLGINNILLSKPGVSTPHQRQLHSVLLAFQTFLSFSSRSSITQTDSQCVKNSFFYSKP